MNISSRARRMTTLMAIAAIAAPLAQTDAKAATHLDPTNLPCTPSCPNPPAADASSVPAWRVVPKEDSFDWKDAGVGAGIGVAAMLAGLAGAFETRRHRSLAR
jgi:hypothetical protein